MRLRELPELQVHTVIVAEGQRPEPSYFGSNDHPGPTGSCVTVFATIGCSSGRSGALTAGL
jgi:hypothetical protein